MNKQEFVEAIRIVALRGAIRSINDELDDPPGRSPSPEVIEMSKWYKSLSEKDYDMMQKVIKKSVESSVFNFLCVLDGVAAIENIGEKGELKLYYEKDNKSVLLNNDKEDYFHNLL